MVLHLIRRSALSISANIAKGYGRGHEKINFYYFARGSATETQSHLEYGKRIKYLEIKEAIRLDNELSKICLSLNKLIASLTPKN